jgi:uncharacterized protein
VAIPSSHTLATFIIGMIWLVVFIIGVILLGRFAFSKSTRKAWIHDAAGVPDWNYSKADFIRLILLSHGLGIALDIIARATWSYLSEGMTEAKPWKAMAIVFCWTFGLDGGAILFYLRMRAGSPMAQNQSPTASHYFRIIRDAIIMLIATIPVVFLLGMVSREMLKLAGIPVRPHIAIYLIQHVHSPDMVALLMFCGVVLAPIGEEIIFRWGLYRFARRHGSRWIAATLSSLVFGALHWNLGLFLPIAAMGFALTIVYEKTGSLTASMVMHSLYNLNSLLAVYIISR